MKATATLLAMRRTTPQQLGLLLRFDQKIKLNRELLRLRHFKHGLNIR